MTSEGRFKKIFGSKITLFFMLLVFIWLVVNLVNILYKKHKTSNEVEDLKSQVTKLEKSNQEISGLIDYFSSGDFLEKEAKERLNLKREGEQVIIIEPNKNLATSSELLPSQIQPSAASASSASAETESNLIKWWKYFFK